MNAERIAIFEEILDVIIEENADVWNELLEEYKKSGDGFGTTIVVAASKKEIEQMIPLAASEGYECGFTFDTSYPIKSAAGEVFTVNALTCAYIFTGTYTDNYETEIRLRNFPLHP